MLEYVVLHSIVILPFWCDKEASSVCVWEYVNKGRSNVWSLSKGLLYRMATTFSDMHSWSFMFGSSPHWLCGAGQRMADDQIPTWTRQCASAVKRWRNLLHKMCWISWVTGCCCATWCLIRHILLLAPAHVRHCIKLLLCAKQFKCHARNPDSGWVLESG